MQPDFDAISTDTDDAIVALTASIESMEAEIITNAATIAEIETML